MAKENYNEEFLEFIKSDKSEAGFIEDDIAEDFEVFYDVHELSISNVKIDSKHIYRIKFIKCNFQNVTFEGCDLSENIFEECQFDNYRCYRTHAYDCQYSECKFNRLEISRVGFYFCTFYDVDFKQDLVNAISSQLEDHGILGYTMSQVSFTSCDFDMVNFDSLKLADCNFKGYISYGCNAVFSNVSMHECTFYDIDLTDTLFTSNSFSEVSFVKCKLHEKVFKNTTDVKQGSCFIDLQTILKSNLDEIAYRLFGIHSFNPKGYIEDLVTEMKFQSVFISYSFIDKLFARALSQILMTKGVKSFFWERDAPTGRRNKHIMYENINKHERLLFIASEHSLKSEACHYELQEARDKQNKEWKDIYFPIHIDNYLFEVRKEDIPRKYREDFWENIEEVKEFHSKDFTPFKTQEDFKSPEFDEAVKQLIKDLKL